MSSALAYQMPNQTGVFSPQALQQKNKRFLKSSSAFYPSLTNKQNQRSAKEMTLNPQILGNQNSLKSIQKLVTMQNISAQNKNDQFNYLRNIKKATFQKRAQSARITNQNTTRSVWKVNDANDSYKYNATTPGITFQNEDQTLQYNNLRPKTQNFHEEVKKNMQQEKSVRFHQESKSQQEPRRKMQKEHNSFFNEDQQNQSQIIQSITNPNELSLIKDAKPLDQQYRFEFTVELNPKNKETFDQDKNNKRPYTARILGQKRSLQAKQNQNARGIHNEGITTGRNNKNFQTSNKSHKISRSLNNDEIIPQNQNTQNLSSTLEKFQSEYNSFLYKINLIKLNQDYGQNSQKDPVSKQNQQREKQKGMKLEGKKVYKSYQEKLKEKKENQQQLFNIYKLQKFQNTNMKIQQAYQDSSNNYGKDMKDSQNKNNMPYINHQQFGKENFYKRLNNQFSNIQKLYQTQQHRIFLPIYNKYEIVQSKEGLPTTKDQRIKSQQSHVYEIQQNNQQGCKIVVQIPQAINKKESIENSQLQSVQSPKPQNQVVLYNLIFNEIQVQQKKLNLQNSQNIAVLFRHIQFILINRQQIQILNQLKGYILKLRFWIVLIILILLTFAINIFRLKKLKTQQYFSQNKRLIRSRQIASSITSQLNFQGVSYLIQIMKAKQILFKLSNDKILYVNLLSFKLARTILLNYSLFCQFFKNLERCLSIISYNLQEYVENELCIKNNLEGNSEKHQPLIFKRLYLQLQKLCTKLNQSRLQFYIIQPLRYFIYCNSIGIKSKSHLFIFLVFNESNSSMEYKELQQLKQIQATLFQSIRQSLIINQSGGGAQQ